MNPEGSFIKLSNELLLPVNATQINRLSSLCNFVLSFALYLGA